MVLGRKRSMGEATLKYAYNIDLKAKTNVLDGKFLKKKAI
jgi:hypothetical protein